MKDFDASMLRSAAAEPDARAYDDYLMRDLSVIELLYDRCRTDRSVIKALCELHKLAEIGERLVPSKLVWVVCSWPDVTSSMLRSFSGFADQLHNIAKDRNSAGYRVLGMSEKTQAWRTDRLAKESCNDLNKASRSGLSPIWSV